MTASEKPGTVPPHGHCVVCGRSIEAGEALCSTSCIETMDNQNRHRRRTLWFFIGFMALLIVVWLFIFSRGTA